MVERVGGMEIFIKQTLETGQEVAVQSLPCDELAVVETDAAVQKQLYAVRYQGVAVLVDRVAQLLGDVFQAIDNHRPLPLRKMKCLA